MGKSKTTTQSVDNVTAGRQHDVFSAGQALAKQQLAPVDHSVYQARDNYSNAANQGNLGLSALSGNADAVRQLSNPYTQQVVDATTAQYGKSANQLQDSIAARAASAGAFGGSRAAVAQGVGLGNLANDQTLATAQLRSQGYQQAQQQASQLAQLGQNANGQLGNIGQYLTDQGRAAQSHNFDTLARANAAAGQHGTSQTQPGSLLGDLGGIASLGASFLVPGAGATTHAGGDLAVAGGQQLAAQGFNAGMNQQGGLGIW